MDPMLDSVETIMHFFRTYVTFSHVFSLLLCLKFEYEYAFLRQRVSLDLQLPLPPFQIALSLVIEYTYVVLCTIRLSQSLGIVPINLRYNTKPKAAIHCHGSHTEQRTRHVTDSDGHSHTETCVLTVM